MEKSIKIAHREFKRTGQQQRSLEIQAIRALEKAVSEIEAADYRYPMIRLVKHKSVYKILTISTSVYE